MRRLIAAAALVAGVTAACGSDPHVHTVTDFSFEGLPEAMSAGDRLEFRNESESEIHELVAFRLADDETRPISELVQLPPDELFGLVGPEPAAVLLAAPGGDMIAAVGDGTFDEPGRYGVICVIPTGADPDEYLVAAARGWTAAHCARHVRRVHRRGLRATASTNAARGYT